MADDKLVKYVKKSSYRSKVLKTLGNDAKMPKEIANDSGILPNHISNVNPEVRKGRLYRLSDNGLDVLEELE